MTIYVIMPDELFNSPIPDLVKGQMAYPENYLVKDCIWGVPKQLTDNRWICDARFRSYYNYKTNESDAEVIGISNNSTNRELYDAEIEQWQQFLGEENLLTEEQICKLDYIEQH